MQTTLVAGLLFREAIGREVWLAAVMMLVASLMLSYDTQTGFHLSAHALAVIGACLFWAFDTHNPPMTHKHPDLPDIHHWHGHSHRLGSHVQRFGHNAA